MTHRSIRDVEVTRSDDLGFYAGRLLDRMKRQHLTLRRQSADTLEAARGGGFIWWLDPIGIAASPAAALKLSQSEHVIACNDALLDGVSQSFVVRDSAPK